ncbi:hypothetical protein BT93_D0456 [Corymbia citriodora subsp. variegata]|nr:hypothetical protein BT93_D0456 [Corymbia citriodora subsp. variegata]
MARERGLSWGGGHQWPPIGAPHYHHHHHHDPRPLTTPPRDVEGSGGGGSQFEYDSVNAVSFGFVATAVLISMFLVMAIFEKFLRPPLAVAPRRCPAARGSRARGPAGKLSHPSPK